MSVETIYPPPLFVQGATGYRNTPKLATKAVFFDRDGTLNVEAGYIKDLNNLNLYPGAATAVKRLNEAGLLTVLTTNQTGAARGYYPEAHIHALNKRLLTLLWEEAGAWLDAVYYSPFYEGASVAVYKQEAPTCRKPATGMIDAARQAFPTIELARSFVVGDKATDVDFAYNAGCKAVLLKTGYGEQVLAGTYQSLPNPPHYVAETVVEAVDWILNQ